MRSLSAVELCVVLLALYSSVCNSQIAGPPRTETTAANPSADTPSKMHHLPQEGCFEDSTDWSKVAPRQWPTVMLAIIARNAEHLLHNYLGYMESLDYPKERVAVWIATDNNVDNTSGVLKEWASNARDLYSAVTVEESLDPEYSPDGGLFEWTDERYIHIIALRQKALDHARRTWADYVFFVDVDNFLVNKQTLKVLVSEQKPIIAPMLPTGLPSDTYANFWCGADERGYYKRTNLYLPTKNRNRNGTFAVPMVHSTILVDLRLEASTLLNYTPPPIDYDGPADDIVIFAHSARTNGVPMFVTNTDVFGYLVPSPENLQSLDIARQAFVDFKLKTLVNHNPIPVSSLVSAPSHLPPVDNLGLDMVFMINLVRRPDRRNRMVQALNELRLNFTYYPAVDGRQLNETYLTDLGVKMLPGWEDPWGERPISYGEIGCFLSHYFIWKQMIEKDWDKILILEDDVDFDYDFKPRLKLMLDELSEKKVDWDLIYVGRKRLHPDDEKPVEGLTDMSYPHYSYWTLGYLLSHSGARKLIDSKPLEKILPVDELFPILFNQHPTASWVQHYPVRDLIAMSAAPLMVFPTHYVGDMGHFSDTEPSMEWMQWKREQYALKEKQEKTRKAAQRVHGEL